MPGWYPNLTAESTFEDFQARLHIIGHDGCPQPCQHLACRLAVEGETCFKEVQWARHQGIWEHPEYYPDLTPESPFEAFQAHLHNINHGYCPEPCSKLGLNTALHAPQCSLMVTYCRKECGFMQRCCIAGRSLESGKCLQPTDWKVGHTVKVTLQEGVTSCDHSSTALVEYFTNDSECSGAPHASMSIPTDGDTRVNPCYDIYGEIWQDWECFSSVW